LQLAPQKGIFTAYLDAELERLYSDHVAVQYQPGRSYCSQVFRQAHLWERIEKSVRAEQWTLPGDPLRIDYSYRRNGTRGFVQTLSVTRASGDFKQLAYTAERIHAKEKLKTEFAAVTTFRWCPATSATILWPPRCAKWASSPSPWKASPCGSPNSNRCCNNFQTALDSKVLANVSNSLDAALITLRSAGTTRAVVTYVKMHTPSGHRSCHAYQKLLCRSRDRTPCRAS
jgi:hypothetical protein